MTLGFDVAWPQSSFDTDDARALVRARHTVAIVGRQKSNTWAVAQRNAILAGGGTVPGEYWESLRGTNPTPWPDTRFIAVAVEPNSGFITEDAIDLAGEKIDRLGLVKVLYSSHEQMRVLGLLDVDFEARGWKCWNAKYDGAAGDFTLPRPYCGFTRGVSDQSAVAGQYGQPRVPGVNFDIDLDNIDTVWLQRITATSLRLTVDDVADIYREVAVPDLSGNVTITRLPLDPGQKRHVEISIR